MATESELKDRILAEIAAHVRVYGRERWDLIREKPEFAPIIGKEAGGAGKRKFYRWVDAVLGGVPTPHDAQGRPFEHVDASIAAMDDGRKRALLAAQKNLPAAPSPAYLVRKGTQAETSLNFLTIVHEVMRDIAMIRAQSVKTLEDGTEKITNLHFFGQQIDKRMKAMDTALRVMQEVWDLQYQQKFYDEIVAIIVEVMAPYPEAQAEAIERLEALNARRGMTLYAEPS